MKRHIQQITVLAFLYAFIFGCNSLVSKESVNKENLNQKQPNIIFIMSDDHAKNAISIYGSRLAEIAPTPNIDRIAKEGIGFTDYYAQQSCTAGRAAFIGGSVPVRSGMTKVCMPGAKEQNQ